MGDVCSKMDYVEEMVIFKPEIFNNWVSEVSRATNEEDRVRYVYNKISERNEFKFENNGNLKSRKCAVKSLELRKAGNVKYLLVPPNLPKALKLYQKSIAFAPYPTDENVDSSELALGFANRSAVLFLMEKYEECLSDVEEALRINYPENLKHKLFTRQGECYKLMGKMEEAKNSFMLAQAANPSAKGVNIESLNAAPIGYRNARVPLLSQVRPEMIFGPNERIPCISKGVEIVCNNKWGRHLRSTCDIRPGDVLAVEEPHAAVLIPSNFSINCYHCFKRYDAMIPCKTCHLVMFCSNVCRELSWSEYHRIECPVLGTLIKVKYENLITMALRILIIASNNNNGLRGLYNLVQKLEATVEGEEFSKGFNEQGKYISSDYSTVHFLRSTINKLPQNFQCKLSMYSAQILKCLECHTELFKADELEDSTVKFFVGGLLLKFICIASINGAEVAEHLNVIGDGKSVTQCTVAHAVYTTLSILQHSCIPNLTIYWKGKASVAVANLPIKKGEQLFTNYIGTIVEKGTEERKTRLKNGFHFTCRCLACEGKCPEVFTLDQVMWRCCKCRAFLPSGCSGPKVICTRCKKSTNINRLNATVNATLLELGESLDEITYNKEAMLAMTDRLVTLDRCLQVPRLLIFRYQDLLRIHGTGQKLARY